MTNTEEDMFIKLGQTLQNFTRTQQLSAEAISGKIKQELTLKTPTMPLELVALLNNIQQQLIDNRASTAYLSNLCDPKVSGQARTWLQDNCDVSVRLDRCPQRNLFCLRIRPINHDWRRVPSLI